VASISKNSTTIVTTKGTTTLNNNDNNNENTDSRIVVPKRAATVGFNVLDTKHMNLLYKRTPAQHVHEKPGKGGGRFKFITGAYVKSQLDRFFGYDWNFEVKSFDVKGDQAIVYGRLTGNVRDGDGKIVTTLVREQFGRADIKRLKADKTKALDFGNDLKAATTDALKKCASDLGIGRDVYAADEYRELAFYEKNPDEADDKTAKDKKYEDAAAAVDNELEELK